MEETEELDKADEIRAYLISRPNALNGKYKKGKLGLDSGALMDISRNDIPFLETLKRKSVLADKMIFEAETRGEDTNDSKVMRELGEKINKAITNELSARSFDLKNRVFFAIGIALTFLYTGRTKTFSETVNVSGYGAAMGTLIGTFAGILVVAVLIDVIVKKYTKAAKHKNNMGLIFMLVALCSLLFL